VAAGTGVVIVIGAVSTIVGPAIVDIYMGGGFALARLELAAIFLAAGSSAISNIPRLMITAVGRATSFNKWLVVAAVEYFIVILLGAALPPLWRITVATLLASLSLTVIGCISIVRTIGLAEANPTNQ
jgi:hypothetical protein